MNRKAWSAEKTMMSKNILKKVRKMFEEANIIGRMREAAEPMVEADLLKLDVWRYKTSLALNMKVWR